jgi:myo-inositol-1-phosphate synthase
VGATIFHRMVMRLFAERGVRVERTYQLNTGGNTDFLNMLSRERLVSKKISKTEAVTSQLPYELAADNVHVGPSDYEPWQEDNKVCFLRIEGRGFGGAPIERRRGSVQDSPNSAGIVVDVIRYVKLARERGIAGRAPIAAYTMKHPPVQMPDVEAARRIESSCGWSGLARRCYLRPRGNVAPTPIFSRRVERTALALRAGVRSSGDWRS